MTRDPVPRIRRCLQRFDSEAMSKIVQSRLWTTWSSLNARGLENLLEGFGSDGVTELATSARDKEVIVDTGELTSTKKIIL
jgi:hypothetical protein